MSSHIGRTVPLLKPPQGPHLIWGGWPPEKNFSHPWPCCQTRFYFVYQATQTPLFLNPLMSPFDTQVYHKRQICLRFHWILRVILEMAFSAHCTSNWKLNQISMTIINKVARKCIWCCHRIHWCVTVPYSGVKLCSGAWKHGQDSHVDMFSLWCEESCLSRTVFNIVSYSVFGMTQSFLSKYSQWVFTINTPKLIHGAEIWSGFFFGFLWLIDTTWWHRSGTTLA